jgi:hypothetical protein
MSEVERKVSRFTWKKLLVGVGASAVVVTGAIGLLHTSLGKPLLMRAGGCPAANAPPEGVQERQKQAIRGTRGDATAPKRVALGFTLDKSTFADVESWAKTNGVACKATREDTTFSCTNIRAAALPDTVAKSDLDEIEFTFRVKDKTLFAVSTWRWNLPEDRAAKELGSVVSTLKQDLGDPATNEGDHTKLGRELYAGSIVKYNFKDYLCTVSGMNLPTKGITMHESYVTGVVD